MKRYFITLVIILVFIFSDCTTKSIVKTSEDTVEATVEDTERTIIKTIVYPVKPSIISFQKKDTIYKIHYKNLSIGEIFKMVKISDTINIVPFSGSYGEVSNVKWFFNNYELAFYVQASSNNIFLQSVIKKELLELKVDSILISYNRRRLNINDEIIQLDKSSR